MKKKTIFLIILALLVLSITGCRKKEVSVSKDNGTDSNTEIISSEENETTQEIDGASEENFERVDPNSPFIKVDVTNVTRRASDDASNRYGYAEVRYSKFGLPEAYAKEYPELAEALDKENLRTDTDNINELERLKERYMEWEMGEEYEDYPTYTTSIIEKVIRADKNVLSILENYYSYEGGAHGYYATGGVAYDVKSGKKLMLSDVVTDKTAFVDAIRGQLREKYPDVIFLEDLDEYITEDKLGEESPISWSIDYSGVTVYFDPYELASYADGVLTARFSFDKNGDILNEKYASVPSDFIIPVTTWTEMYADVDADGEEESIGLFGTQPEPDWDAYEWKWAIGDSEITDTCTSYENDSYLVKKDGKFYAYMFNRVENDYQILSIIDIATGKELGGEYGMSNYGLSEKDYGYDEDGNWNTVEAFINPESFELASRLDVLGTYSGVKKYRVGDDGIPKSDDEFYRVDNMYFMIRPIKDLPCKLIDKDGNMLEEKTTLPKDTLFRIIRTNGENIADVQAWNYVLEDNGWGDEETPYFVTSEPIDLNQGTFYRIEYEKKDYEGFIGGESIFDLFQGMMFAG